MSYHVANFDGRFSHDKAPLFYLAVPNLRTGLVRFLQRNIFNFQFSRR